MKRKSPKGNTKPSQRCAELEKALALVDWHARRCKVCALLRELASAKEDEGYNGGKEEP